MHNGKTAALIVTYNPLITLLNAALTSLLQNDCFIVIIDNASNNIDEIEKIPSLKSDRVFLLKNKENLGIATAQNIGAEIAIKAKAEYLIYFDQDSQCTPNMIEQLMKCWGSLTLLGEKVGAIGPSHLDPRSNTKYPVERYFGPFLIKQNRPSIGNLFRSDFLMASGLFTSVRNWQLIGKMREDLFIDYVDHEWCFRANSLGFSLFVLGTTNLVHTVGDNRKKFLGRFISLHSPIRRYYLFRNGLLLLKCKHVPFGFKLRELVRNLFRFMFHFLYSQNKSEFAKLSFLGFYHGIKAIGGPLKRG